MIHADTDGLLDKCHCGAVAGFELREGFCGTDPILFYRARCTDCAEQTEAFQASQYMSAVNWNLLVRRLKNTEWK
jgi:hypothetical protein